MPDDICDDDHEPPQVFDWKLLEKLRPSKRDPINEPPSEPDPDDLRNALLKRVYTGEVTREDAELEARARGWQRFVPHERTFKAPAPAMVLWTPEMVLAWIRYRNWAAVHRHFEPSFKGVVVWKKTACLYSIVEKRDYSIFDLKRPKEHLREGYEIVELRATRYPVSYLSFSGAPEDFPDLDQEYPELQKHLINGVVTAVGRPAGRLHCDDPSIKATEWVGARFHIDPHLGGVMTNHFNQYTGVHFRPKGVQVAYRLYGAARSEMVEVDPWRDSFSKLKGRRLMLANCLKNAFPAGMPRIRPIVERDKLVKEIFGVENVVRWQPTSDDAEERHLKRKAFSRAVDRLLKVTLVGHQR